MANIRVDLNHAPLDGEAVTFKAPCDASEITGLVIYYDGESKAFTLTDANGGDIGVLDNIFSEGAIVKAILDTDGNKAFVQNPNTNTYLEGELAKKYSPTNKPTAADAGAVSTNGGKITGDLYVEKSTNPFFAVQATTTGRHGSLQVEESGATTLYNRDNGWTNYSFLRLNPATGALASMLKFGVYAGEYHDYDVLHSGNFSTYAAPATAYTRLTIEKKGWYRVCSFKPTSYGSFGGVRIIISGIYNGIYANSHVVEVEGAHTGAVVTKITDHGKVTQISKVRSYAYDVDKDWYVDVYYDLDSYNHVNIGVQTVAGAVTMYGLEDVTDVAVPDYTNICDLSEWRNPPMQLGVEYRTTERVEGDPVYAQLRSLGALLNSTTKTVSKVLEAGFSLVGIEGHLYNRTTKDTIPVAGQNFISSITLKSASGDLEVVTNANVTAWDFYPVLKYIKR